MEINKKNVKVGVFIPARNEEKNLPKTLKAISEQDLKPSKIVVVNDGSIDKTFDIAKKFGSEVIDLKNDGLEGQGGPKMTRLHEIALVQFDDDYDYILQLDADHIIPTNYISYLVSEMEKNPKIVIAGCLIDGKKSKVPMGSGRLVRFEFHKQIGIKRKIKHGLDTYPLFKAKQLGYEYKIFKINTKMLRKQGVSYRKSNFIAVGKTCKALGYHPKAALLLFFKRAIKEKKFKIFLWQLRGFLSTDVELYDEEFRKFVRQTQSNSINGKLKQIFYKNRKNK